MKTTEKVLRVIDRVNINQRTYERHNSSFIYNEIDKKKKFMGIVNLLLLSSKTLESGDSGEYQS